MAVTLGHNQYGKAETRVVRVYRDSDPHEIVDYNVSAALSGDFADTHLTGDNALVLTTDAVKNTVNAYAKEQGEAARQPESFGLALARHFVGDNEQVTRARMKVEMYPWVRLDHDGSPHPHAFARHGGYVRTATVTCDGDQAWVVSGVDELVVLKTTDSEFWGYYQDKYTTLKPTNDRIMATKAKIQWWRSDADADVDWGKSYDTVLGTMSSVFAGHHSLALQQTIYAMGEAMIESEAGDRRGPVLAAEQAPLRDRPEPVRAGQPERGLPRRRPAVRPHRGHGSPTTTRPIPGLAFDPGRAGERRWPDTETVSGHGVASRSARTATHPVDEVLKPGPMFLYGLQHVMSMYAGVVAVPLIVGSALELPFADLSYLLAATLLVSGLATLLQTLGVQVDRRETADRAGHLVRRGGLDARRSARPPAAARPGCGRSSARSWSPARSGSWSAACSAGCCTSSRRW